MNRLILTLGVVFCLAAPVQAETIYITDVNVIPMNTETVLEHQTVVVSDGKISMIGPADSMPVGEGRKIDGAGKFLLPALAEMHAHVPGRSNGMQYVQDVLNLYLANGITTIRGMLGQPWHLELRGLLADHEMTGARLITSGPSFNGSSVSSPEQAAKMAREQHAAGYDFLKLHPGLTRDEYIEFVATAKDMDIPFAGHVSAHVGIPLTLESGQATIDHLDGYTADIDSGFDEHLTAELAAATMTAGVWNVPTQSLYENRFAGRPVDELMARPEMVYVDPTTAASWRNRVLAAHRQLEKDEADNFMSFRRSLIHQLQVSGAGLLLGSDAPQVMNVPGFAIHEELEYLVNAGLTPYQALVTGTVNIAAFFNEENRGSIQPGFVADMVLLNDNPLNNISNTRNIEGVMRDGRWFGRAWLDTTLAGIRERKI
jgi:imidazolonepropionase-like amidohydrolase